MRRQIIGIDPRSHGFKEGCRRGCDTYLATIPKASSIQSLPRHSWFCRRDNTQSGP